jgi:hypothetical protein
VTASVTIRLGEAAARLREVGQTLSGPGPLAPALYDLLVDGVSPVLFDS